MDIPTEDLKPQYSCVEGGEQCAEKETPAIEGIETVQVSEEEECILKIPEVQR